MPITINPNKPSTNIKIDPTKLALLREALLPPSFSDIKAVELPANKVLVIKDPKPLSDSQMDAIHTDDGAMAKSAWLTMLGIHVFPDDIRKGTFTDVKRSPYIDGPEITSAMVSTLAHLPYSWSASSDEGLEITADTRKLSPQIREILGKLLAIAKGRNPRLTCEFEFPLGTKLLIGGGVLATAIVGGILIKRHMDA